MTSPYQNIRSLVHICSKLAASLRHIVTASLLQTRFSYANFFSCALFWPTMCAASMQRTVVAHCTGTQCAPQVCSAQLSRTVLAHNVRRKYAAHSCRALFWHTMCAASLQHTVVAHCAVLPPPLPPTPPQPYFTTPPPYFLVPYPQGECEKKCWDGRSVTENKNLGWGLEKMQWRGDGRGYIKNKNLGWGGSF